MAEETDETAEVDESTKADEATERRTLTDGEVIARKSADVHKSSSDEHVKVFVIPPGPKPTEANGFSHEANKAAVIQYMLNQGMRPTGEVRLVSTKKHDNGVSWVLTYAVPAKPTAEVEGPSEPDVVLGPDGEAPANTTGAGHSEDTSGKAPKA